MNIRDFVRDIPDFPAEGVVFKDITPLLKSQEAFSWVINSMAEKIQDWNFETIIGPESRGFIFATPLSFKTGKGFVPVRKPGKLPYKTYSVSYDLEYGSNSLEMHTDALKKGERVIIVDDILATGGTIEAIIKLVEAAGGIVEGIVSFAELSFLNPRDKIRKDIKIESLVQY
ncbi:MAG: adenine phosphoribosyltransferase [Thermotogae bacterium]|jgi:adenine phosphoribosyltransferase|nr:adenine phosphoribosyltransferase [Thermotogota bacterium]MCP5465619.1 adenine phosphoribosyltransferase [Thermotogota bacterium]HOO74673.1 adenine phosphoribosyltransferase [Tepiditoga sp.]